MALTRRSFLGMTGLVAAGISLGVNPAAPEKTHFLAPVRRFVPDRRTGIYTQTYSILWGDSEWKDRPHWQKIWPS